VVYIITLVLSCFSLKYSTLMQLDAMSYCHCLSVCVQLMLDGSFAVSRRTWIDTEGSRWTKRSWSVGLDADNISLLIGM